MVGLNGKQKRKKKRPLCKKTTIPFSLSPFSVGLGRILPKGNEVATRECSRPGVALGFGGGTVPAVARLPAAPLLLPPPCSPPARLLLHPKLYPCWHGYWLGAPHGLRPTPSGPIPLAHALCGAAGGLASYLAPHPQARACSSSSSRHHGRA
jgi:hypothetical protein